MTTTTPVGGLEPGLEDQRLAAIAPRGRAARAAGPRARSASDRAPTRRAARRSTRRSRSAASTASRSSRRGRRAPPSRSRRSARSPRCEAACSSVARSPVSDNRSGLRSRGGAKRWRGDRQAEHPADLGQRRRPVILPREARQPAGLASRCGTSGDHVAHDAGLLAHGAQRADDREDCATGRADLGEGERLERDLAAPDRCRSR